MRRTRRPLLTVIEPSPSKKPAAHAINSDRCTERMFANAATLRKCPVQSRPNRAISPGKRSSKALGRLPLCRRSRREYERERRPPRLRLEPDRAAHQLGELACDRDAEAAAGG